MLRLGNKILTLNGSIAASLYDKPASGSRPAYYVNMPASSLAQTTADATFNAYDYTDKAMTVVMWGKALSSEAGICQGVEVGTRIE